MKKRPVIALALATLALSLWLGVAVAQQAAPAAAPAPAAAEAVKPADAAAPAAAEAAKPAAGAVKKKVTLEEALDIAKKSGVVDESKPAGFLGIPGAPSVNPILAFAWAVWVGWIFSTVGAFGGVMAGVGHMSVFGFGAYAGAFKKTAPDLGKIITDSIKASNQFLVGTSAAISSFNYMRMGRLVLPLAISLGLGSLIGAYLAAALSAGKLDFKSYQGYFGLFVLFLGCWLFYQTTEGAKSKQKTAKLAAKAFEDAVKKQKCGESLEGCDIGLKIKKFTASTCEFTFYGVPLQFNPLIPFIGGAVISAIAAFLGVGGGFLLVPFLTSVTQLPMYLAAGTSALAVLVSMITSIITLISKGTPIEWGFIGTELIGIAVGSFIGPMTSKYLSDKWMKRIFIVLSVYIGAGYTLAGFTGFKIPGV
ncbi:hypothetical protein SAMN04488503_1113 [Humidesulfovibrio mexicanus]|uniref:Probable membrane transporter protein n=1 Tax=Humidesulfovibrio mexicanus TaxID=147047 RepID=A0A238Z0L6_9BACT|nr:sulfite exporter TauE/SafE family protein [Humidesulfovibrio mexicanus]SNR76389.1 hypothetical protein SAMN04488503_1113 [Humidesulfovibrio mexicanus]